MGLWYYLEAQELWFGDNLKLKKESSSVIQSFHQREKSYNNKIVKAKPDEIFFMMLKSLIV